LNKVYQRRTDKAEFANFVPVERGTTAIGTADNGYVQEV